MKKKGFFLFLCMIFVGSIVYGQQRHLIPFKTEQVSIIKDSNFRLTTLSTANNIFTTAKSLTTQAFLTIIQPDYYTKQLGFFCKKEWQLEKAVKVPFKFRVGTVQYCDWMEGKIKYR
jgi:hypothetical protein